MDTRTNHGTVKYNFLGNSGLKVSNVCFGTMTFGEHKGGRPGQTDEAASHQMLDRFVELGGNFIDTADLYANGTAEQYVGSWMKKKQNRDDIVIATKVRFNIDGSSDPNKLGLSRRYISQAVEHSLKRLQTDYIDLYQIHCWDIGTPIQETLRTMDDLIRSGKVRYVGASNVKGWQLQKIMDECRHIGLNPWISLQAEYSLMTRGIEYELIDVCRNEGIGVLPWSPLKGGWLTGKVRGNVLPPEGSRVAFVESDPDKNRGTNSPSYSQFSTDQKILNLLDVVESVGKEHGKTMSQVAIRWLLQQDSVSSVIIGAKTLQQLDENMAAGGAWELTDQQLSDLDKASQMHQPYPYELVTRYNKGRERQSITK
ncbi:1-deoxyxylulose-5-phosphate synthase YajO-like [Glandiceps talaboti]